jgi:hypothetical protein
MYFHPHDFAYADAWCVMHVLFWGGGCGLLCICVCRVWSQGKKLGDLAQEWERQRWWRQPSHCRTLSSVGQIKERCNKKTIQIERKHFERSKWLQSKASILEKKQKNRNWSFQNWDQKTMSWGFVCHPSILQERLLCSFLVPSLLVFMVGPLYFYWIGFLPNTGYSSDTFYSLPDTAQLEETQFRAVKQMLASHFRWVNKYGSSRLGGVY